MNEVTDEPTSSGTATALQPAREDIVQPLDAGLRLSLSFHSCARPFGCAQRALRVDLIWERQR